MPLAFEQKKAVVAEVADVASSALSAVAAEYRGLTVSEMTEFRKAARSADVVVRVVPNNLAKRAVAGTEHECLQEALQGPLILAFSRNEPGSAARVVRDFAKEHNNLKVKAVTVGGKLHDASQIDFLATLPNREEAIAMLLRTMKAPTTKLVRTIAEPHAALVRVLAAVADKKKQAA